MSAAAVTHPFRENGQRIERARKMVAGRNGGRQPWASQEDFAAQIGTTRRHMIRLENGEHLPGADLRDRIVELSGTPEQIDSSDDDEEAALIRALTKRLGTYSQRGRVSWRGLYENPSLETAYHLRHQALHSLAVAREIEESLS